MTGARTAVIVGSGVVGLTTACPLRGRGWGVRLLADRPITTTTSARAAAVWFPTRVGPRDRVAEGGARTYDRPPHQAHDGGPGVLMRETLALYRDPPEHPWWAEAVHGVRPAT